MRKLLLLVLAVPLIMAAAPKVDVVATGPFGTPTVGQTVSFNIAYDTPRGLKWSSGAYVRCVQDGIVVQYTDTQWTGDLKDFPEFLQNPFTPSFTLEAAGDCTLYVVFYEWRGGTPRSNYLVAELPFEVLNA